VTFFASNGAPNAKGHMSSACACQDEALNAPWNAPDALVH